MVEINTIGSSKRYAPAGYCIYCGARDVPLSDEHIVPFGFGGNWVLPKSSCEPCRKMTNEQFENPLMRGHFYPVRVHMKFPSRKGDPAPDKFPVKFTDDNSMGVVAIEDHPCPLMLPKLVLEPGLICSDHHTPGKVRMSPAYFVFQEDLVQRANAIGRPVQPARPFKAGHFFRLLAKIGHSFALAELGEAVFDPIALPLIKGHEVDTGQFIGGTRDVLRPKPDFHDLWLTSVQTTGGTYLVANVQLLASVQGPVYRIVVGKFPVGSRGLHQQI